MVTKHRFSDDVIDAIDTLDLNTSVIDFIESIGLCWGKHEGKLACVADTGDFTPADSNTVVAAIGSLDADSFGIDLWVAYTRLDNPTPATIATLIERVVSEFSAANYI